MGLFEKKECAICGNKIGLLGTRKVEDGVICSDCTKKLSPFFSERKRSTVADIQQQLAYREQNKQNLAHFNATRTLGNNGTKVILDDQQRKFVVSKKSDFRAENADIIDIAQVSSVRYEVKENRTEQYTKDANGNRVSYTPPRYDYDYDFKIFIDVNHPYFSEIEFELSSGSIESRYTEEYRRMEQMANEIVAALGGSPMAAGMGYQQPMGGYQPMNQGYQQPMGGYQPMNQGYQQPMQGGYQQPMQGGYQQPAQGGYQQSAQGLQWICPNCGTANTTPFCQGCGSPKA